MKHPFSKPPLENKSTPPLRSWWSIASLRLSRTEEIAYALLAVSIAFFFSELMRTHMPTSLFQINAPNVSLVYMIACAFISGRFGLIPGLITAIISFMTINYFYMRPYYRLAIDDITDTLNMGLFLSAAVVIALFVSRSRATADAALRREYGALALLSLQRATSPDQPQHELLHALRAEVSQLLETRVEIFVPSRADPSALASSPTFDDLTENDRKALEQCWNEGKTAGVFLGVSMATSWCFKPLMTLAHPIGVLAVYIHGGMQATQALSDLLDSMADQIAAILEKAAMNEQVKESYIREEREKLRSMLLSSVSHDLKTPLASIIGSLSLLRSPSEALSAEHSSMLLETAHEEAERLERFISNILNMTRLEGGKIPLQQEWRPVMELVARVHKRLQDRLRHHRIEIAPIDDTLEVKMDAMMTEQVVQNLLDNAAKYTPPGSTIEIYGTATKGGFTLSIRDHGQGIPEENQNAIFDKYTRLHKEDSQIAGTGLGLAICKAVMEAQGGRIAVSNHPEGGAVFSLFWPEFKTLHIKSNAA